MNHALLVKSRVAAATIGPYLLAAATGVDGQAAQAAAPTDKLLGVVNDMGAASVGQTVDIQEVGLADVMAGAAFVDGAPLTTDAQGRAVAAVKINGSTVYVAGFARSSASAAGDIVPMLVAPFLIVG